MPQSRSGYDPGRGKPRRWKIAMHNELEEQAARRAGDLVAGGYH
jgi:hypothetical protein